jgi:hypothetical protein
MVGGYPGSPHPYNQQAAAPQPMVQTVWGVPLEPGERVLYYKRFTGVGERIFLFFMSVLFFVVLCGFWLLYLAIFYEESHDRAYVITNRRFFTVSGKRKLRTQIHFNELLRVEWVTGAKQRINIHSAKELIIFRLLEHHRDYLENVVRNLSQAHSLPEVQYEP